MTTTEVVATVAGLILGYWIVAVLLANLGPTDSGSEIEADAPADTAEGSAGEDSAGEDSGRLDA